MTQQQNTDTASVPQSAQRPSGASDHRYDKAHMREYTRGVLSDCDNQVGAMLRPQPRPAR